MANQITSQREENFEDPFKFWPERWLSNSSKEDVHFSYLPFGHGIRSCLGKNMAEAKMMLLTAKVYKFNPSLSFDRDIIPKSRFAARTTIQNWIRLRRYQKQIYDGECTQ